MTLHILIIEVCCSFAYPPSQFRWKLPKFGIVLGKSMQLTCKPSSISISISFCHFNAYCHGLPSLNPMSCKLLQELILCHLSVSSGKHLDSHLSHNNETYLIQ